MQITGTMALAQTATGVLFLTQHKQCKCFTTSKLCRIRLLTRHFCRSLRACSLALTMRLFTPSPMRHS